MVIDLFDAINEGTYQGITVTKNADRSVTVSGEPDVASVRISSFVPLNVPNGSELTAENNQMTALNIMTTNKADETVEYWSLGSTPRIVDNDTYTYQIYGQVKKAAFVSPVTFTPLVHSSKGLCSNYRAMVRRRTALLGSKPFTFVNYIAVETTSGPYLQLDLNAVSSYSYECDVEYKKLTTNRFFGDYGTTNAMALALELPSGDGQMRIGGGEANVSLGFSSSYKRKTLKIEHGILYQDGAQIASLSNKVSDNYSTNPLVIFGYWSSGRAYAESARTRIYSFKIKDKNGNLLRDLKPCVRKADNAVGMYDEVTKTFYGNAGTGAFTYG